MAFVTSYAPTITLNDGTTDVLERLGDHQNGIWSRAEIKDYLQDGYDIFCGRTKCLYDIHVIENLPITGNWQTDLEKAIAETKSGWALTDNPFHFTGAHEKNLGTGGRYGQSMAGPSSATNKKWYEADNVNSLSSDLPSKVPGGLVPPGVVQVLGVTYDSRALKGMSSQHMRDLDPQYENRDGDPQFFMYDKDGIYFLRVVPAAGGTAVYDTVDGSFGILRQRLDADSNIQDTIIDNEASGNTDGWGLLRYRDDFTFCSGGSWGTPTRVHPEEANIEVMHYRLGRSLKQHPFELPRSYVKYVYFWAMYQALDREGSGQQLEMADHYKERFEMGISRMTHRKRDLNPERAAAFGRGSPIADFGLGDAQLPYPYGHTD